MSVHCFRSPTDCIISILERDPKFLPGHLQNCAILLKVFCDKRCPWWLRCVLHKYQVRSCVTVIRIVGVTGPTRDLRSREIRRYGPYFPNETSSGGTRRPVPRPGRYRQRPCTIPFACLTWDRKTHDMYEVLLRSPRWFPEDVVDRCRIDLTLFFYLDFWKPNGIFFFFFRLNLIFRF